MPVLLRRSWRLLSCLAASFIATTASADEAATRAIPPELRPWIDWVMTSDPTRACAVTSADGALCAWPGQLELDLDAQGGRFVLPYEIDGERDVALVGSHARWPEQVRVDGHAAPVIPRGDQPIVHLSAGKHRIEGVLRWSTLPERLELPVEVGLLSLRVNGQAVPFPKREDDGSLWLGAADTGTREVDDLSLSVTRKITDGVPLMVVTRLSLRVSGRARELSLGKVALPGTTAIALSSELPARLSPGGELRVQARAGMHSIEITSHTQGSPEELHWLAPGKHWPAAETWAWEADEALRQVAISGAASIDPSHTELAEDWRSLQAYVVRADTKLRLATLRRGEATPPPNRVSLSRDLWLDLDGRGYTVRDHMQAELKRDYRLSLTEGALGRVNDGMQDLLITLEPSGHAGVELRSRNNSLVAEWRADDWQAEFPAVAWSQDVQSLSTRLHMGPGWSVLTATGVDEISQSWMKDWDLFGFFFVLVVTLAFAKLFGVRMGVLALAALVLTEHESEAPHALWFLLVVAIALLHALPTGWLRTGVRAVFALTAVSLLIVTVLFAVTQIRLALYPQLTSGNDGHYTQDIPALSNLMFDTAGVVAPQPAMPASAPAQQVEAAMAPQDVDSRNFAELSASDSLAGGIGVKRARMEPKAKGDGYANNSGDWLDRDPDAVVQTGPGLPTWGHRVWELRWVGPVDRTEHVRLWLLSPAVNRLLALLRALLLGALVALVLVKTRLREGGPSAPSAPGASAAAALLAFVTTLSLAFSQVPSARAQAPSAELLEQLRQRLQPVVECHGQCVSVQQLDVTIDATQLRMRVEAHAQERSAVILPGPASTWSPKALTVDGKPAAAMLREGFLLVRVEAGVHQIEASGPLPQRDSLLLAMPQAPHRTHVAADGWAVDGVRDDGQTDGSLLLSRLAKSDAAGGFEEQALPEWLVLERRLRLGTTWQIENTLRRVSPMGTPVIAHLPLLPGESVVDAAFEVQQGKLAVSLARDVDEARWTSTLSERPEIALTAAKDTRWSEQWIIECSVIWHCELSGLAPLGNPNSASWMPTFSPWPGESLKIALQKPKPAPGQSTTIDDVHVDVTPGQRIRNTVLDVRFRASRGGAHHITLGERARVQMLKIDDQERTLQQTGSTLGFTLEPGEHRVHLEWQEPSAMGFSEQSGRIVLDGNAVNIRTALNVPSDRWLLWASGPAWGPAILFWGRMLLVLLLGLVLGRTRSSPLRGWEWMLLGLGLTQIEVPLALFVVGWFFVMQQRSRAPELSRWPHNLMQLGLVFWTFIALVGLYEAVQNGLLVQPDMQVAGAGSTQGTLRWYSDQASGELPRVSVISAPLWVYRVLMLGWALWLASRCVRWLPWALSSLRAGKAWKAKEPKAAAPGAISTPAPLWPPGAPPPVKPTE